MQEICKDYKNNNILDTYKFTLRVHLLQSSIFLIDN